MIFIFWDKLNDEPEILGEDGEFYFYNEDQVAIRQNPDSGRNWVKINKMQDVSPLNDFDRFDFFSESTGDWIEWARATKDEIQMIHRAANDPDWADAGE